MKINQPRYRRNLTDAGPPIRVVAIDQGYAERRRDIAEQQAREAARQKASETWFQRLMRWVTGAKQGEEIER